MKAPTPDEPTLRSATPLGHASGRPLTSDPLVGVVNAPTGNWIVPLPEKSHFIVGRSSECDVSIPDGSVSRRHLRVHVGTELAIEDIGSANGTTYDAKPLRPYERTVIELGHPINLGGTTLFIHAAHGIVAPGRAPRATRRPAAPAAEVVRDDALRRIYDLLPTIAPSPLSVLILGETGVGKEVFADAIHRASSRASGPFLKINCAALPESILEGELFGYERGAFSGAITARPGLFEAAHEGTVFLDEVGELTPPTQAKLLRVLESGEVMRLGSRSPTHVDVRFVAATNRDLAELVAKGAFRADLFYRLEGVRVEIPPLRERADDVIALAEFFIARLASRMNLAAPSLSPGARDLLRDYAWPGNVRELRNVVERAVVMNPKVTELDESHLVTYGFTSRPTLAPDSRTQTATDLVAAAPQGDDLQSALETVERRAIVEALEKTGGNQSAAARLLKMGRHALIARIEAYGLSRPRKRT
ncbi:MAG: sigma 54-interacting transcriptional regulator [Labilithrix sp.]|nr:sigma 54-interacting transcriptional regulator [Labilithrix sp.]MCW5836911.1 sigma 54-interacting transcriptional regulator [Labilithrix sp.]